MNRIEKMISEQCPNGVNFIELNKILNYIQPGKYIVKDTNYKEEYKTPVLTAGQTFILGYTNEEDGIYHASKNEPVIIFDDFTTSFHWVEFDFKVKSSAMKMLILKNEVKEKIDFKYVFYCMSNIKHTPKEHSRQWIQNYSNFKIAVPPLEIQQEIVHILDDFSLLSAELSAELKARQQQYEYYRNKLLSFDKTAKNLDTLHTHTHGYFREQEVRIMHIWEITIWDKKFNSVKREKQEKVINYPYLLAKDLFKLKQKEGDVFLLSTGEQTGWTTEELAGDNLCEGEIVTIPWGKSRPVKEVMKYYNGKFITADNRIATSKNTKILLNKYLYYWMLNKGDEIDTFYRGSGIKHPNMNKILDLEIEIPDIEIQEKIIEILDKFDKLTNDISEGLPAEIEARKKQYEYYRNKLLTFKELKTA